VTGSLESIKAGAMTSLTFLTACRTPDDQLSTWRKGMWLTLSDVVLSSVSELDSLVLTGGSTGWDSGSVKTLGGGDLDLDGRVTCSSQQVYSTHQLKEGKVEWRSGAELHFLLIPTEDFSLPPLSNLLG
jgi:hypothetical protein